MVTYSVSDRIGHITLDRPEKRNALNDTLVNQLKHTINKAIADDNVKIILLKANGPAFSAGADLAYLQQLQKNTYEENLADSQSLKGLFELIYTCPKVIIAQVQGHAIAGGFGLATVCDFVFSVPEAKFGYTEVKIGFIPAIVMVFLLRKIGEGKARELLLTGDLINAEKAHNYGLINFIVEASELESEVLRFAKKLCLKTSAQSLAATKQMISQVSHMETADALNFAAQQNAKARASTDCQKGIAAFVNKEKIEW